MVPSIEKILKDHYVDGVFHTHVSMIHPKGSFQFSRQDLEMFWDVYIKKLGEDPNMIVGVAEKPQHYLPVLVDVDLKIKDSDEVDYGDHLYTEEQVVSIVKIYQEVLRNIVDGCKNEHLTCILLEKPIYYLPTGEITYVKNGFHLHFPHIFLSKVDQEMHLIPRIHQKVKEEETFSNLGFEDSSTVIDKSYCTVPWLLYGSRKSESMDTYSVTKVFDYECSEIDLEKAFKHYKIYDINEQPINIRGHVREYLPRILSVIPYGRDNFEIKHGLIAPFKEKIKKSIRERPDIIMSAVDALKISEQLLPMLSDFRAEDRNEWMTII